MFSAGLNLNGFSAFFALYTPFLSGKWKLRSTYPYLPIYPKSSIPAKSLFLINTHTVTSPHCLDRSIFDLYQFSFLLFPYPPQESSLSSDPWAFLKCIFLRKPSAPPPTIRQFFSPETKKRQTKPTHSPKIEFKLSFHPLVVAPLRWFRLGVCILVNCECDHKSAPFLPPLPPFL